MKGGVTGWWGNSSDLIAPFYETATGDHVLFRSGDGGSSWVEIGNADDLFASVPIATDSGWYANPETWKPDENVIVWAGITTAVAGTPSRIRYTYDNGTHWLDKMGNWVSAIGAWSGGSGGSGVNGNSGCIPLPRIGPNAESL
jgi:hypothetical protein